MQQGIDILFTNNPAPAKAAQMATSRIPIVFYGAGDPIRYRLIQSFAHPGGNITGVTDLDLELDSKRLEIFKEMMPGLTRVLFLYDKSEAFSVAQAKIYRESARRLKIMLIEKTVVTLAEDLGVQDASENDLYAAMDSLLARQEAIQKKLAARHLGAGSLVLYDLSSSYFEGTSCPLAKLGYNREGKTGLLQVNYGVLTDARGCPVAVSVYEGNVADSYSVGP